MASSKTSRHFIGGKIATLHVATVELNKLAAELLGTFAMVFAGTGAIVINDVSGGQITHAGIALTFGFVVMAMIYAVGSVSGAHLNPAVTTGFWLARRLPGRSVLPYVVAQLFGAMLASGVLRILFGNVHHLGATLPAGPPMQSFVLEAILTAILMFVILGVSTGPKEVGVMAGIAIGGVIAFEAMFAGPICGASMNPARSFAPALISGHLEFLWIYLIAPVMGAAVAVPCWRCVYVAAESDESTETSTPAQLKRAIGERKFEEGGNLVTEAQSYESVPTG